MTRLYLQHLAIEVANPRKATGSARPDNKGLLRPGVCHRPIFDVLKHIGYVQRFDIRGDDPGLNVRTVKYIVKLLRKLDISVRTFCLIVPREPAARQDAHTEVCMELFNFLVGQRRPEEGAIPHLCDEGLCDTIPGGGQPTVLEQGNGRLVILCDGTYSAGRRFEPACPVLMTGDNRVFGCIRLDTQGMIVGYAGNVDLQRPLCPASRFLRYVKSTQHKPATPCKKGKKSPAKSRNGANGKRDGWRTKAKPEWPAPHPAYQHRSEGIACETPAINDRGVTI